MKRFAVVGVLVLALSAGVDAIGDLTQTRPDRVPADSRTDIVFEVRSERYRPGLHAAADGLWGACAGTTGRSLIVDPGIVEVSPGRFRLSVEPGLGEHARRRLVGCLEDLTIERVKGVVVSVDLVRA
ncbi:MAG: hypothetical protein ACRD0U_20655 [Acidimicrobiales bacterium]